ncbi:MAG: PAS domain S-box protein [Nitrospirota bacterium]
MPGKRRAGPSIRRKRSQRNPDQREARLRAILDGALDAVIGMDASGRITDWNKRAEVIFGWMRGEALGRRLDDTIIPPRYREAHERGLQHFLASGDGPILNRRIETTALRRDGTEFPAELTVTALKEGKSYSFSAFVADITERKQAEEALKKSQQILEQAQQVAQLGIWHWDIPTNTVTWSDQLYRLFGLKPGDFPATYEGFLSLVHPEDRDALRTTIDCTYRSGRSYETQFRALRQDGTFWWNHSRGEVIRNANGVSIAMIGVAQDVTERKRAERDLQQREEQLWEMLGQREQLSQDLHDNIIQKIYAVGLHLEESKQLLAEDVTAASGNLDRAIADLNGVIRDVRNYISGIDPGTISSTRLRAELAKLVHDAEGALLPRFRLRLDPDAIARLNVEQAKQVLLIAREALSNSLRHSRARNGFLSLRAQPDRLRLEIVDDGIGFDARQDDLSGHGLRNMTTRAQKLGGRFEVVSAPGQGTRIIVDFPKE